MNTTKRSGRFMIFMACAGVCLAGNVNAEDKFTVSAGLEYSTGDYGSSSKTDIWFMPLTARYESGASTFKLTLPYLQITAASGATYMGIDGNGRPIYGGAGKRQTESGIGDIVVAYKYSLFENPVNNFLLDIGAKAKLATADEDKGLGTGENDYAAYADLYYVAGAVTPFMTLGYRWMGDPKGVELRNVVYGTLGLAYKHSPEDNFGMMWDVREATSSGSDGVSEATVYWTHKLNPNTKLQSYALTGFSDSSPDWGLGVTLTHSY